MSIIKKIKNTVMQRSRAEKMDKFFSLCRGEKGILDVGVSSEFLHQGLPARNYFLKNYPYSPDTYTGLGIQDLRGMSRMFPKMSFVQYQGGRFPFKDKCFRWVFSNAVIEHVGKPEQQLEFVDEMLRVSDNVFFTTPNKHFPVEAHTNLLFLHWFDDLFSHWCRRYRPEIDWKNLNLISERFLKLLLNHSKAKQYQILKNRFFGIPMTFTVICSDQSGEISC